MKAARVREIRVLEQRQPLTEGKHMPSIMDNMSHYPAMSVRVFFVDLNAL